MTTIADICRSVMAKLPHEPEAGDECWVIDISGYGHFLFVGNKADCDRMCTGKAEWEGTRGRMWMARSEGLDSTRRDMTEDALISALKNPKHVATWRNYGRAALSPEAKVKE